MSNPWTPAHQLSYAPIYARSYADRNLAHLISSNPQTVATMKKRYGRYLSGFGSEDMSGATGYDPRYQGQHIYDLEKEDDTFGSGVFDPKGRGGTDNPNMGIFAGHYSLPGYVARDVPFTVMKDVTDITDDAAVVSVPGGGMFYVEDRGRLQRAAGTPPTWRPAIQPPGWTRFDQVYASEAAPPVPMHGYGQAPVRRLHSQPARVPHPVYGVPGSLRNPHLVPQVPAEQPVGYTSIVHGSQLPVPVTRARHPVAATAPDMPMEPQVPFINTVNVATERLAIEGFGQGPRGDNTLLRTARSYRSEMPPTGQRRGGHRPSPGGILGYGADNGNGNDMPPVCEPYVKVGAHGACLCPDLHAYDPDKEMCTKEAYAPVTEDKPISAMHLAIAGLLLGAGVGVFVSVTSKGGRR